MHSEQLNALLEKHYLSIDSIILSRQDAITGLLPASTAITAHGDYTDAWVRDNVYSILSVWGLSLSYRKHNPDDVRSYTLSQSVVKLMRGLLMAMMRQSNRVETFKTTLNPTDALHAKYGTSSGLAVVGDDEWGHLQLDATSLYLLMMAQMIASGLKLIYTMDEVNFVQNLVHYISHTYCTADYGIWERGNKINHGTTEINCSSVGMAKAALEAMSGFNLFGNVASHEGIIHVIPSDIARSRFTLHGLLPRESNSKETDAALLSIIGYPAYAIEDESLIDRTRHKIIKKLAGNYGCKRFLLDGHQSSIEDPSRLHYEPSELREFADIESEWPLFFTYLLLDAHMREDAQEVEVWREKLEPLFVDHHGQKLLPELYLVPKELIDAEKENPKSQLRIPNENIPLVWAQSLFILSDLIQDSLLHPHDIDPLCRRERIALKRTVHPLVTLIAENETVKEKLLDNGIYSETLEELHPIQVMHATELSKIHTLLGRNTKLGLSGRPMMAARTITTARLHLVEQQEIVFLPYYFNPKGFYFNYDNTLLVKRFRSSLKFLATHWDQNGQPLLPFLVREDMLSDNQKEVIFQLLYDLQKESCNAITIKTGSLKQILSNASIERIDNIHEAQLQNLNLHHLGKEDFAHPYSNIIEHHYESVALKQDWNNVRRFAEVLGKYDNKLEDALLDIIIHQKRLAIGRAYSEKATFSNPLKNATIVEIINESCGNNAAEGVLTQEIMIYLGELIQVEPELFTNMLTLRTWYFVQLLVGQIIRERELSIADAYEHLISLAPHDIYERIHSILRSFSLEVSQLNSQENLNASGVSLLNATPLQSPFSTSLHNDDWLEWRVLEGMISRVSNDFYKDVWHLLRQCNGLVIGDKYSLQSRIGSELTLDSTAGEQSFAHRVDDLLQSIEAPEYRQLNIEVIKSLSKLSKQMPDLQIKNDLVLDVLIGHAVRIGWKQQHPHEENYDDSRGAAWEAMYTYPPEKTAELFIEALMYLLSPQ
ncbi:glycoside hydrolase family 15 protein [Sulfuricurvum sp.]|uniref:glycoside hydrolase family 15 protein n=1 Tax=Sulfuricurvum sp. TaxID=2025608 RepID=UPI002619DF4D|nr:glycoside hydrolase family 15 protein [Sulfuricurvum sp.]MDD2781115.1 glycoside hydrolase family 15 protein [Sulfuricurvum sp.]